MGNHSKVSFFSTEWRLGENTVLRSMEYLAPTVKFSKFITISHLFVCRPTLALTTFEQQVCSAMQMRYHWEQAGAKKKRLNSAYQAKKSSVTLAVFSQHNSKAVYIASSESCKPKRFSRCWDKVERKCIQEQQPNQFYCYNQNMGLSTEWTRTWPITGLVSG